jgi:hypothetical protein
MSVNPGNRIICTHKCMRKFCYPLNEKEELFWDYLEAGRICEGEICAIFIYLMLSLKKGTFCCANSGKEFSFCHITLLSVPCEQYFSAPFWKYHILLLMYHYLITYSDFASRAKWLLLEGRDLKGGLACLKC